MQDDRVAAARARFGIVAFRPQQRMAINAALDGQDVMLLMATGSGKSLCFQLPGLADPPPLGLTLVVSPLKSLMLDQVLELSKIPDVRAEFLTADTPREEARQLLNAVADPKSALRFLYVTPERVAKSKTLLTKLQRLYEMGGIKRFVVDEVHCVSIDGNDFRPDYLKLVRSKLHILIP